MLKKRIIPTLLLKGERLIKGIRFKELRDVGNPVTTAKVYDAQFSDELILLNINPNKENWEKTLGILARTSEECFMPLTVGGGIQSLHDIKDVLRNGGDKVAINSHAVTDNHFIREASDKFGKQCIIVSIDYQLNSSGKNEVMINGGSTSTGIEPLGLAVDMVKLGAGELLITSIDRDGTRQGYDVGFLKKVVDAVSVPVIARGGVGTLHHFVDVFKEANVSAVAAGSIFHFTDQSPIKARTWLKQTGIDVRIP